MKVFEKGERVFWDVPGAIVRGVVQGFAPKGVEVDGVRVDGVAVTAVARVDPKSGEDDIGNPLSTFNLTLAESLLRSRPDADAPEPGEGGGDA